MNPRELIKLVKRAIDQGLDRCPLVMDAPHFRGPYPRRVRTPFGLCEWYPSARPEKILIYPKVTQIIKWMDRQPESQMATRQEKE